jgi:hypothetical protein
MFEQIKLSFSLSLSQRELTSIPETVFKNILMIGLFVKCIVSGRAYFEGDKINLNE